MEQKEICVGCYGRKQRIYIYIIYFNEKLNRNSIVLLKTRLTQNELHVVSIPLNGGFTRKPFLAVDTPQFRFGLLHRLSGRAGIIEYSASRPVLWNEKNSKKKWLQDN